MLTPVYYEGDSLLHRLNPLSKLLISLPLMVLVGLSTEVYIPLAFIALTVVTLLGLGRIPLRRVLEVTLPMLVVVASFLVIYPLVVRREVVADTPLWFEWGPIMVYQGAVLIGLATGLRIYALVLLSLPFSLTTQSADFIRALVQQWHFPYRLGYSALAAFRFVPMLHHELNVIRAAHRVRGVVDGGGWRGYYAQMQRYAIPLLATAIRHAERTALAMDGRAFGASETRTYYRKMRFAPLDYGVVVGYWAVSLLMVWGLHYGGLLGGFAFIQQL